MIKYLAATLLAASISISSAPASADVAPPHSYGPDLAVVPSINASEHSKACNLNVFRAAEYAAQAVDSFATAAAIRARSTPETPYSSASSPVKYLVEQAAFDSIVGALTRRASCSVKKAISAGLGASALYNASIDGRK